MHHIVADRECWDPFPPAKNANDSADRSDANRAVAVSAAGLALRGHSYGHKTFHHPEVGDLTLGCQVMTLRGTPGQANIAY
jgi:hypothetical protein